MTNSLAVLVLEDAPDDAELLLRELARCGYEVEPERVETARAFEAALDRRRWDIVLADYSLPGFGPQAALDILRKRRLDIPVLVVSGVVGEEAAVDILKAGAHDYIPKDRLARLVPAVRREIADAAVRRERRRAQEDLQEAKDEIASYHGLLTHDVANFATVLQGVFDQILSRVAGPVTPLQESLFMRARRQVLELQRLAENARLIVRLREKGLPVVSEPVDLGLALRRAAETVRAVHFDRPFDLHVNCPEGIRVSGPPLLENILLNLLDNAVRYGARDRTPSIEIKAVRAADKIDLRIRGGIPPSAKLLGRMVRRRTRGRAAGHGLGLALAREIVERSGGRVETKVVGEVFEVDLTLP